MDFYIDESGNTGDLARTEPELNFGDQAVFSLAAVGFDNLRSLEDEIERLKRKHKFQGSEFKAGKLLRFKDKLIYDIISLLKEKNLQFS